MLSKLTFHFSYHNKGVRGWDYGSVFESCMRPGCCSIVGLSDSGIIFFFYFDDFLKIFYKNVFPSYETGSEFYVAFQHPIEVIWFQWAM